MHKIEVARGAVLGALAGDAAGATLEFIGRVPKLQEVKQAMKMVGGGVWQVAPGQITDDGEMTLCLVQALAGKPAFDRNLAAKNYRRWLQSMPFDVGITTRKALNIPAAGKDDELASAIEESALRLNMGSKANGSLMRITPLAVWSHRLTAAEAMQAARCDARLTHPNPACQYAAAAYVLAIRHLVLHPGDADGAFHAAKSAVEEEVSGEVRSWLQEAERNEGPPYHPLSGFVRIAFTHAFRHLILCSSYPAAIKETLQGGGDTDTNACIVGGLVGALHGIGGIPEAMWRAVTECDTGKGQPRPEWLSTRQLDSSVRQLV